MTATAGVKRGVDTTYGETHPISSVWIWLDEQTNVSATALTKMGWECTLVVDHHANGRVMVWQYPLQKPGAVMTGIADILLDFHASDYVQTTIFAKDGKIFHCPGRARQ